MVIYLPSQPINRSTNSFLNYFIDHTTWKQVVAEYIYIIGKVNHNSDRVCSSCYRYKPPCFEVPADPKLIEVFIKTCNEIVIQLYIYKYHRITDRSSIYLNMQVHRYKDLCISWNSESVIKTREGCGRRTTGELNVSCLRL